MASPTNSAARWPAAPLLLLLAARLALGAAYGLIVPLWEGYDEDSHFAFARYVAARGALPQPGDPQAEQSWEKFQPPLYYLLIALVVAPFGTHEIQPVFERNPYVAFGDAGVNYAIHSAPQTDSDQATTWAALAARFAGVLLGAASVLPVYAIGRRLWPTTPEAAWTAAGLYAFWPQFVYLTSVITNDLLVVALSAGLFWVVVRLAHEGPRTALIAAAGALLGAALLTKLNALGLIPMTAAALVLSLRVPDRSRRPWLVLAALALGGIAPLVWLGSQEFIAAHLVRPQTLADLWQSLHPGEAGLVRPEFLLATLRYGFRSFVAAFGRGNLEAPDLLYGVWSLGIGLAAAGAAVPGREARQPRFILTLALWQVGGLIVLYLGLALSQQTAFLPGRYLLPALPGAAVLITAGWQRLASGRRGRRLWKLASLGVVLTSWALLLLVIAPAYAKPQRLPATAALDQPLHVVFDGQVELLGYRRLRPLTPGRPYSAILCWQAVASDLPNYPVRLEVRSQTGETYGQLETYPGRGNFPTSLWPLRAPFCDEYRIPLRNYAAPPAVLQVSLLDGYRGDPVPARASDGAWAGPALQIPIPTGD